LRYAVRPERMWKFRCLSLLAAVVGLLLAVPSGRANC